MRTACARLRTRPPPTRRRAAAPPTALFGGLFGGAKPAQPPPAPPPKADAAPPAPAPASTAPVTLPAKEEVVLRDDVSMADGSPAVIVYSTDASVDPAALDALCAAVGWPPRPAPAVATALAGSYLVASLLLRPAEEGGEGGGGDASTPAASTTLVGLARATSDGAFNATIWDVLVHPDWQGRGLGKDLVERVAATLLDAGISNVTLFADAAALPFYEALGFEADPEGIRGMFYAGK